MKRSKTITLHGTIINAADYNTEAIFGGLPVKPRNQIIEIQLDEDFWQILHLKNNRIKILIEEKDIPEEIR
ncbi:hypothetical protein JXB27_03285 [Candidatus Woesearchaeota archaeon]|nr:hypothetical protein [Candidatus Woesearchaeota archaeon]